MPTIARRLLALLTDHRWGVGVILGGVVGALFGGGAPNDPRATTYVVPSRRVGLYPGDRGD
jgi:hypothetical protein